MTKTILGGTPKYYLWEGAEVAFVHLREAGEVGFLHVLASEDEGVGIGHVG